MITTHPGWRAACRRIWFSTPKNETYGNLRSSVPGLGKYDVGKLISKHDIKRNKKST